MLNFKNKALDIKLLRFMQIEAIMLTANNVIFNGSLFTKCEIAIRFLALQQVWEWSRILILSPGWPYKQNEAKF